MSTKFIEFPAVKKSYPILDVARALGLVLAKELDGARYRGACPYCQDRRSFTVTPAGGKDGLGISGCFKCGHSKDSIGLVAALKNFGNQRDAAEWIVQAFGTGTVPGTSTSRNSPQGESASSRSVEGSGLGTQPSANLEVLRKVQARLLTSHEAVQALGIEPETAQEFGAGYDKGGTMRGRFLVPIHTRDGTLVGFCGIATDQKQQPDLLFPRGVDPAAYLFNAHRVAEGEPLALFKHPLHLLRAYQDGITNAVAFFGEATSDAVTVLTVLMEERGIPDLDL